MGEAIATAAPIGIAMAFSPFPIIGIVVILAAPGGRARGLAFLAGSLASVAGAGAVILAFEAGADPTDGGDPATWVSVLKLAIAALLVAVAVRTWRGRPARGETPAMPGWMAATETLRPWRAAGLGALLSGANPKNLVLIAAAATAIAGSADGLRAHVVALAVFVACACAGVALPVAATALWGERASPPLRAVRGWMLRHNAAITTAILALIAAMVGADALAALAGT